MKKNSCVDGAGKIRCLAFCLIIALLATFSFTSRSKPFDVRAQVVSKSQEISGSQVETETQPFEKDLLEPISSITTEHNTENPVIKTEINVENQNKYVDHPDGAPEETSSMLELSQSTCPDYAVSSFVSHIKADKSFDFLNNWTWHNESCSDEYFFAPLSGEHMRNIFLANNVVMFGDSTLFYFTKWIQTTLLNFTVAEQDEVIEDLPSSRSISSTLFFKVKANKFLRWKIMDTYTTKVSKDGVANSTVMAWRGIRGGWFPNHEDCYFDHQWDLYNTTIKPGVFVVNMGLHWLQLTPGRKVEFCNLKRWVFYEQWLQEVYDHAIRMNVSLLLFKTNNQICDKYLPNYFLDSIKQRLSNETAAREMTKNCVHLYSAIVSKNGAEGELSQSAIKDYCLHGTFDNIGVIYLNNRIFNYVSKLKSQTGASNTSKASTMKVGIFNDHDMMECQYTSKGDGRHYHRLHLFRLRLLINVIDAYLPTDTKN